MRECGSRPRAVEPRLRASCDQAQRPRGQQRCGAGCRTAEGTTGGMSLLGMDGDGGGGGESCLPAECE